MIGLDTNVLLRWLVQDDILGGDAPHQVELVRELVERAEETLFVNQIVIVEIIWVLRSKAGLDKDAVVQLVTRLLLAVKTIVQDRDLLLAALESYSRYPGDFSDHLIGEINKHNGCRTTLTFDRAAAKSPNFSALQR
jgi:predicted nucleic-acid-binding protein